MCANSLNREQGVIHSVDPVTERRKVQSLILLMAFSFPKVKPKLLVWSSIRKSFSHSLAECVQCHKHSCPALVPTLIILDN